MSWEIACALDDMPVVEEEAEGSVADSCATVAAAGCDNEACLDFPHRVRSPEEHLVSNAASLHRKTQKRREAWAREDALDTVDWSRYREA